MCDVVHLKSNLDLFLKYSLLEAADCFVVVVVFNQEQHNFKMYLTPFQWNHNLMVVCGSGLTCSGEFVHLGDVTVMGLRLLWGASVS